MLLTVIIVNAYYNYFTILSKNALLEECGKGKNEGVTGGATAFCLRRSFKALHMFCTI